MCDSFQTVWHKALQSAQQMVLLFTLSGSFVLDCFFLSFFFYRMLWLSSFGEEIHQICSGALYLSAHKLYMPESSRK